MGLFGFFKTNKEEIKSSVYDLFKINLKELSFENFIDHGSASNGHNSDYQIFSLKLDYLECGIFNKIEVYKFKEGLNVFFKSNNLKKINLEKVSVLVDSLYKLYGNDYSGKGKFSDQDKMEFLKEFNLFNRTWMKVVPFIRIDCNREENEIVLSIQGIKTD